VLEEHSVLTGVGALVAATTSENYPVPVRRVGIPDVYVDAGDPATLLDRYGLGTERIRDEAWELLQLRGKVQ
jgi:transketolase